MKKSVNQYLNDARNASSQKFANADGNFDNTMSAGAFANASGYANASGAQSNRKAPTSMPYVINVTSTSGAAVQDFAILGANTYVYGGTGTWVNGSLVVGSITISSGTPGVTYQQMLAQFQQQPFTCGLTYYKSATTNQVDQVVQIVQKDATGMESKMPIVPTTDPYQFQSGIIVMENQYNVDGWTSLVIASVLANATITFQLYQSEKINLARGLEANSVQAGYSNPGIVKAQEVVVKQ
jgi:hypothetical protein